MHRRALQAPVADSARRPVGDARILHSLSGFFPVTACNTRPSRSLVLSQARRRRTPPSAREHLQVWAVFSSFLHLLSLGIGELHISFSLSFARAMVRGISALTHTLSLSLFFTLSLSLSLSFSLFFFARAWEAVEAPRPLGPPMCYGALRRREKQG